MIIRYKKDIKDNKDILMKMRDELHILNFATKWRKYPSDESVFV